ncbi:hypothetical protein EVJ58_g6487 [Rhodofomes roseus]|uniref:Pentatricopeptide repeat protein n=1 Tax=Rhodofomes roseus TaxID=34475 RepID=A0A4Y9Y8X4_9APHY|nr:hypothetical protein EVJ58_g6487 [Rhodofomes roseus]
MFICRHGLLRAYLPRHVTTLHFARRSLSRALPLPRAKPYAGAFSQTAPRGEERGVQRDAEPARDEGTRPPGASEEPQDRLSRVKPTLLSSWFPDEAPLQTEAADETANLGRTEWTLDNHDPSEAYLAQRRMGRSIFRDLEGDPRKIFRVLEVATKKRQLEVIRLLVVDMVQDGHFLGPKLRLQFTERLLLLAGQELLSKKQALSLLDSIQSFTQLMTLSDTTRLNVAVSILAMPRSLTLDPPLLDKLALLLLDYVNRDPKLAADSTPSKALSLQVTSVMYLLAYELAAAGLQRRSLDVVNALIHDKKLDSHAIQEVDLSSGDFVRIILFALVRSSTSWGWRRLSTELIERTLPTMDPITPDVGDLAMRVLRTLVVDTTYKTVQSAATIIVQLMERCPECKISGAVLQQFYAGAQRHNCPELAEMVYSVSQSGLVRNDHKHVHLPPDKGMLHWFLRYLTEKQKHTHLARVLASQLIDEAIPIALHSRGPIIAILASQGFAMQARALWERYEDSKDADVVVGNAATMLRLVSLFVSLSRRSESQALLKAAPRSAESVPDVVDAAVASMVREGSTERALPGRSGTSSPVPDPTHAGESDSENTEHDSSSASLQPNVVEEDESGMPCTQVTECSLPEGLAHARPADGDPKVVNEGAGATRVPDGDLPAQSDPSQPLSAETTETEADDTQAKRSELSTNEAKRKASEFRGFAERVFDAFLWSRGSFKRVHHWELNAMARASFMLGRLEDGLDVFQQLFKTRQVPDMYDINVALSIFAEYNPSSAALVIERMLRMGLQPDAVSFGSVIHHAVMHGDLPLATALIRRAREVGVTLSYKTVGTLLRAAVTLPAEDGRLSPRAQLQTTSDLVDLLLQARKMPSPNMGRDCVNAALRADDPAEAFRFWQLLVKDKVEWGDGTQVKLREALARRIREHYAAGQLNRAETSYMLRGLRELYVVDPGDTGDASAPRGS